MLALHTELGKILLKAIEDPVSHKDCLEHFLGWIQDGNQLRMSLKSIVAVIDADSTLDPNEDIKDLARSLIMGINTDDPFPRTPGGPGVTYINIIQDENLEVLHEMTEKFLNKDAAGNNKSLSASDIRTYICRFQVATRLMSYDDDKEGEEFSRKQGSVSSSPAVEQPTHLPSKSGKAMVGLSSPSPVRDSAPYGFSALRIIPRQLENTRLHFDPWSSPYNLNNVATSLPPASGKAKVEIPPATVARGSVSHELVFPKLELPKTSEKMKTWTSTNDNPKGTAIFEDISKIFGSPKAATSGKDFSSTDVNASTRTSDSSFDSKRSRRSDREVAEDLARVFATEDCTGGDAAQAPVSKFFKNDELVSKTQTRTPTIHHT